MCFQGFVYFACGHQNIVNHACELALTLDVPFYNLLLCPAYTSSSARPDHFCGYGKYYCEDDADASFLDHAHHSHDIARVRLRQIDFQFPRLKEAAKQLAKKAKACGMTMDELTVHNKYLYLDNIYKGFMHERPRVQNAFKASLQIITEAQNYYQRLRQHWKHGDGTVFAALTPPRGYPDRLPAELSYVVPTREQSFVSSGKLGNAAVGNDTASPFSLSRQMTPRNTASAVGGGSGGLDMAEYDNIHIKPRRFALQEGHENRPNLRATQDEGDTREVAMPPPPSVRRQDRRSKEKSEDAPTPRKRKWKRGAKLPSSTFEDSDGVRRSGRVRNKKISYAEESSSDMASRDPSPAKSESSTFSPVKSERSFPPAKRRKPPQDIDQPRRSTLSLVDKIGDWKRRGLVTEQQAGPQRSFTLPGIKSVLNASLGQDDSETIHALPQAQNTDTLFSDQLPAFQRQSAGSQSMNAIGHPNSLASTGHQRGASQPMNLYHQMMQRSTAAISSGLSASSSINNPGRQEVARPTFHRRSKASESFGPRLSALPHFAPPQPSEVMYAGTHHDSSSGLNASNNNEDSAMARTDSARSHFEQMSVSPGYGRMRRSFSSGVNLAPLAFPDQTPVGMEPKKRNLPASSPNLPRGGPRLSLPGTASTPPSGRNDFGTAFAHYPSMSSPPKMATQDLPQLFADIAPSTTAAEEVTTTVAPIFAPTAVMYVPSDHARVSDEGQNRQLDVSTKQYHGAVEHELEPQFDSSEIDWSLINEDAVGPE